MAFRYKAIAGWPTTGTKRVSSDSFQRGRYQIWRNAGRRSIAAGIDGHWKAQGIWNWRDGVMSISYRELKAIRLLLSGSLGTTTKSRGHQQILLHMDSRAVVHIANSFVSASQRMMRELRKLKRILGLLGFRIKVEWLPSVANKFADGLSQGFPRDDLQIRRQLRRSAMDSMDTPADVFPYRPLGENRVMKRRQAYAELNRKWDRDKVRALCPPVDLTTATVHKLRVTKFPVIVLIPDWRRQPWHQQIIHPASRVEDLQTAPEQTWKGYRKLNSSWRWLLAEVNMEGSERQQG